MKWVERMSDLKIAFDRRCGKFCGVLCKKRVQIFSHPIGMRAAKKNVAGKTYADRRADKSNADSSSRNNNIIERYSIRFHDSKIIIECGFVMNLQISKDIYIRIGDRMKMISRECKI